MNIIKQTINIDEKSKSLNERSFEKSDFFDLSQNFYFSDEEIDNFLEIYNNKIWYIFYFYIKKTIVEENDEKIIKKSKHRRCIKNI